MCSRKAPPGDPGAPGLERASERLDAVGGQLRGRRGRPRGPAPPPYVAVERELRHDEDLATDLGERAVHLAPVVLEHPQVHDLLRKPVVLAEGVLRPDADQQEEPAADLGDDLPPHADRGPRDALQDQAHGYRGTTR